MTDKAGAGRGEKAADSVARRPEDGAAGGAEGGERLQVLHVSDDLEQMITHASLLYNYQWTWFSLTLALPIAKHLNVLQATAASGLMIVFFFPLLPAPFVKQVKESKWIS